MSISFANLAAPQASIIIVTSIGRIAAITALAGMILTGNHRLIGHVINALTTVHGIPLIAIIVIVVIAIAAIDHLLITLIYKIINQRIIEIPANHESEQIPILEGIPIKANA
jgi:hypothetical protein